MTIFVQIAAYRDSELVPTLAHLFETASRPDEITVGLCWQYGENESLGPWADDPRIRRIEVPASQSQGVCWARSLTQSLYQGEDYTLQLDSHHRFIQDWDRALIEGHQALCQQGIDRPIITAYLPAYEPGLELGVESEADVDGEADSQKNAEATFNDQGPLRISFGGFSLEGPWAVKPEHIELKEVGGFEPARFVSGHFLFADGAFCHHVPYDPGFYFFGEEHSLALRAFSHGYRFFHPTWVIAWHHYGRMDRPKHWSDDPQWASKNQRSLARYRALLNQGASLGQFGLGPEASLADYQQAMGVDVVGRQVSEAVLRGEPPAWPGKAVCDERVYHAIRAPIEIDWASMEQDDRLSFIYVGAHDASGTELFRQDLVGDVLKAAIRDGHSDVHYQSAKKAVSWTVWPYAENQGWLEKRVYPLDWM